MDAHAHLTGLGWRGQGHSLDNNNRGLKRPLLISHKTDLHGLGSKKQSEKQADQWWLNAFDNALKDLGEGKQSSLAKIKEVGVGKGGLYGFFVKGQVLESTFDSELSGSSTPTISEKASKSTRSSTSSTPLTVSTADEIVTVNVQISESIGTMSRTKQYARGQHRFSGKSSGANSAPLVNNRMLRQEPVAVAASAPEVELRIEPVEKPTKEKKRKDQEETAKNESRKEKKKRTREWEETTSAAIENVDKPKKEKKKKSKEEVEANPYDTAASTKTAKQEEVALPLAEEQKKEKKRKRQEDASEAKKERKRKRKEAAVDSAHEEPLATEDAHTEDSAQHTNTRKASAAATDLNTSDDVTRHKKEQELERMVSKVLRQRELRGDYGPILPHPSRLLQIEKEVYQELKSCGQLGNRDEEMREPKLDPVKKIRYKEWKREHQRRLREAKQEIEGEMRDLACGEEYIPETEVTPIQLKERKKKEKAEKRARRAKREEQEKAGT